MIKGTGSLIRGKDVSRREMSVKSLPNVTIPLYAHYSTLNLIETFHFVSARYVPRYSLFFRSFVVILAKILHLSLLVTGLTMNWECCLGDQEFRLTLLYMLSFSCLRYTNRLIGLLRSKSRKLLLHILIIIYIYIYICIYFFVYAYIYTRVIHLTVHQKAYSFLLF